MKLTVDIAEAILCHLQISFVHQSPVLLYIKDTKTCCLLPWNFANLLRFDADRNLCVFFFISVLISSFSSFAFSHDFLPRSPSGPQGLEYCEERFSQEVSGSAFPLRAQATNTRLLSCQTIEKFRPHPDRDDSMNEG